MLRLGKFTDFHAPDPLKSFGTYLKDPPAKMSDQIVKHDNSLPGFLLILLPAAFVAVFLSIAWPFILGGVVFLTGNNIWQSYQWAKLSQQVNPYFSQMVLEQQGEIAPLALSARANISAPVANRYLQGKAAEIGGVSYRSDTGGTVYSFLTVNSLENTFAGLSSNESISQKLAELDDVTEPASQTLEASALIEPALTSIAPETVDLPTIQEQPASSNPVAATSTEPVAIAEEAGSSFAQALRGIFDAGNEPVAAEVTELEKISDGLETITQVDLAKRLDVHPSTLYKRRSDMSFGDWTRNRDPEGFGWGYQRDTKEFYRLT